MNSDLGKCIGELNSALFKKIVERNKSFGFDITPVHGAIICAIMKNGELCQKDIEEYVSCNKSTLSSVLDTMERNGLIIRTESKTDSRKKIIKLTSKAKEIHNFLVNDKKYIENILKKDITSEELSSFLEIANRIKCSLERN